MDWKWGRHVCQNEGGLDAGEVEIRRSVITGEGAFELGLTDRDNFKGEKLGMFWVKGTV